MTTINESFIVNKDTTDLNNNSIIKKGTIVKGAFSGVMPNGEIRITTDKGQIINLKDLQSQNQPIVVKPTTDGVKQQNLNLAIRGDVMTQEDKFYEMFGIKKSRSGDIGIQSRPLGRLLVAVVLIGGYFAYKKFKK